METLMDVYKSVESPLDDIDIIKKCIELYFETKKSGRSLYSELLYVNSNGKENKGMYNGYMEEVLDNWRMNTFKNSIVNMTPEKYALLFGNKDGYYCEEFRLLRAFLMQTRKIDLYKIGEATAIRKKIEENSNLKNAFQKYGFDILQNGWDYISSSELLVTKPVETPHRLYINMDGIVKYRLIGWLINEFSNEKIPFHFKYNDAIRDDTIVMWTDNENLVKTIELLKKIREEHKEQLECGIFQPPLLSGRIDNWIGYGSEPTVLLEGKRTSYNKIRAKIAENAIANVYSSYSSLDSKKLSVSEIVEMDDGFIQAVRDEIIRVGREYGIDESNFCFDRKTVQRMKQIDSKSKQTYQQQILNMTTRDIEPVSSSKPAIETEETQDLETLLIQLNRVKENDEQRKAQKQVGWRKKFNKRDKDYYRKAEAYLLGELKRLSPEERKRGNQYLSALEQGKQRNK